MSYFKKEVKHLTGAHVLAYRQCHHDFKGLSIEQAALALGWPTARIRMLLREAEEIAPQLFPILSHRQARVRELAESGFTNGQIAEVLHISRGTVCKVVSLLRKKGALPEHHTISVCRYDSSMDLNIKEKF
jgi:DNA-directed RNA polymerase specialized sigma24 family protein